MSVNLKVGGFSANLFTLDQENIPTDAVQFLKGLNVLALRALDALSKPEDVELAFQRINYANLVQLSPQDKTKVDQRIQDVFNGWVKVTFGDHFRHVPRERLAKQCGPKFQAQYTSGMKEASDRELDLQSADTSKTDGCPEECKEPLLVYLQTGTLPPGALGANTLNMLVLAEQHQLEELIQECLDFLIDNLSIENLDTFLEFTRQTNHPQLEVACLNFMKTNRDPISEDLKIKYQEELSIVKALASGEIILTISSSGKIVAEVKIFTKKTTDVLQKISKQFPIESLILPKTDPNTLPNFLEQIAPTLKSLQELVIWNETPSDNDLPKLKNLFPNLKALGNNAPFLITFDEVKTYVKNFKDPGEDDKESNKPLLRSLNLEAIPNLTDTQLDELTPYLQELYHLVIKSDKITSVVAPKATRVQCRDCTNLITLEAPAATWVSCNGCTALTTLEAPKTTSVYCNGCTVLTTLEAPKATRIDCSRCTLFMTLEAPKATRVECWGCSRLTTLDTPKATSVICNACTALTALEAPIATWVDCSRCTLLTTLKAPKAIWVDCRDCAALTTLNIPETTSVWCTLCIALTTLEAPKATSVYCNGCTQLTTLKAPKATKVNCCGCTALTTLEAPKATSVDCRGCKALTTLEAPKATRVDCLGCTALITLKTPEATEIDCRGSTQLTTLEVPAATYFAGESKFIRLTRILLNSIWAFSVSGCQSFFSLFGSRKNYDQNIPRVP